MENETPTQNDELMNNPYAQHLMESVGADLDISDVMVECVEMFQDIHTAYNVLAGEANGNKKESAVLIREVFGLKGNAKYQVCQDTVHAVLDSGDSTPIAEYVIGLADGHVEDEQDDIEDVVEDDSPAPASDLESRLDALEASLNAALNQITDTIGKMAATPQPQVVEDTPAPEESDAEVESETVEYGLKVNRGRLITPKGWKDKENYTVGVITDTVDPIKGKDGNHPCRHARGMTPEDATRLARNMVRRRLTMRIKGLRAKTQDKDTWVAVAAEHGITDAVIDQFITKPNKHALQARRTALNLRNRLGITNVVSFNEVADRFLDGDESPSPAPVSASKPSLLQTPSNGVATVDTAQVLELMNQGFTAAQAKEYLASL